MRNQGSYTTNTLKFSIFKQTSVGGLSLSLFRVSQKFIHFGEDRLPYAKQLINKFHNNEAQRVLIESDARAGQKPGGARPYHLGRNHYERSQKGTCSWLQLEFCGAFGPWTHSSRRVWIRSGAFGQNIRCLLPSFGNEWGYAENQLR